MDVEITATEVPSQPPVRGFLHTPAQAPRAALVLTHGAGANCNSPLLRSLADTFAESAIAVLRCDLPFRQARPYGPPPPGSADPDQEGLRHAIEFMREQCPGPIFLGGHSYGGRQASMLAASNPNLVDGLLLLSYPLHPPKKPSQLRTSHFHALRTPALFVLGSRDGFATVEELKAAVSLIPAPTEISVIENAGHELLSKRTEDGLALAVLQAFEQFIVAPRGDLET